MARQTKIKRLKNGLYKQNKKTNHKTNKKNKLVKNSAKKTKKIN